MSNAYTPFGTCYHATQCLSHHGSNSFFMTINVFNLLILVGAVHGLFLSVLLLLTRKSNPTSRVLLAMVLIFYTLPVLRVTLFDMGLANLYQWPFFSVELLYGLGPSLYLYVRTLTRPDIRFKAIDCLHYVPVLLELLYYYSPWYREVNQYLIVKPENIYDVLWLLQQFGALISVLIYIALSIKVLIAYAQWVKNNYSDDHQKNLDWLQKPVLLYSMFFLLWFSLRSYDVIAYADQLHMSIYYPLLLLLSFTTYWIGTKGFLWTQMTFKQNPEIQPPKQAVSVDQGQDQAAYERLDQHMQTAKPYLINDLALGDLATMTGMNPRQLSRVINQQAAMNFYDYVNQYRLREFKHQLSIDHDQRILDLAYACGFNSKSTFNHLFKKHTGMTPSAYKKQLSE